MAPRFKTLMYAVWENQNLVEALVCFPLQEAYTPACDERRRLFAEIFIGQMSGSYGWKADEDDDPTHEGDMLINFYESRDWQAVKDTKPPQSRFGKLWWSLRGGRGKLRSTEGALSKLLFWTACEYSNAIQVETRSLTVQQLEKHVLNIAKELGLTLPKTTHLPSLPEVMRSNATFDINGRVD